MASYHALDERLPGANAQQVEDGPVEAAYLAEQRRFRRLEASLPVWWCEAARLDEAGGARWGLGYTRDLSLGGAKIVVPASEASRLRQARERGERVLLRFETKGEHEGAFIEARLRHAAPHEGGGFWIGVAYEPGAEELKLAALRAGLRTIRSRRKWQSVAVAVGVACGAALLSVGTLKSEVAKRERQMMALQKQRLREVYILDRLNAPKLAASRAEGYDTAFQSRAAQAHISKLTQEMARLSSDANQQSGAQERTQRSIAQGVLVSDSMARSNVRLGVALPYGYAWPQVTGDLEQLLGRDVPYVVLFRDWRAAFPIKDAREARLRAKTLQITWEPWSFSDPNAVKLTDIASGKSDAYIDAWAQNAKSFGSEIWIRWGHEFNGNWYPWCLANNGGNARAAAKYIAAYRHVVSRFRRAGAYNVRFAWCFNVESVPDKGWNDPRRAYPGDDVVDAIAMDGYNFGSGLAHGEWTSFEKLFAGSYNLATRTWPNKPLFIGETGCATQGGDKARWLREMDVSLRAKFPRIEAIVWFEADKEADWRMVSSPQALAAAKQVWSGDYYQRGTA